jgi:predicted ABC-type ATPase
VPKTTAQRYPKAIVLAGQPGAGKGGLARAVEWEFSENIVKIDPDELRDYHPGFKQFRAEEPYTGSNKTHPDASAWAKELREAAIAGQRNVLLDTTLGNADSAIQTIKDLPILSVMHFNYEQGANRHVV